MKEIFKIYKRDLKRIFTNYAAIITITALCILPSLYAWFNIAASWDPYSSKATSGIKIGVINNDKGTVFNNKELNLGTKITEQLKDNKQLGWQFMSYDECMSQLKKGEIYAAIEIPKEFSENMTSILTSEIKKPDIKYTVNEKINAIAPKLTDKGATSIVQNVKNAFSETVSGTLLSEAKALSLNLEIVKPRIDSAYYMLKDVESSFENINNVLDSAGNAATDVTSLAEKLKSDIPNLVQSIDDIKNLTNGLNDFFISTNQSLNDISPAIKESIKISADLGDDINNNIDILINSLNNGNGNAGEIINNIIAKTDNLKKMNNSVLKLLKAINGKTGLLDNTITRLNNMNNKISSLNSEFKNIKNNISNGTQNSTELLNRVKEISNTISSALDDIYSGYDDVILNPINRLISKLSDTNKSILNVLEAAQSKLPLTEDLLDIGISTGETGEKIIEKAKERVPKAEKLINELTEKLNKVLNNKELDELLDMLRSDIEERTDFLANPVNLIEEKLFPMDNYGTAMTPFYTTLSLWTGILFLVSLLSLDPHKEDGVEYSVMQSYFGKLLLFITICIIQSIIVSVGDLFILGIYCVHPVLFVMFSILTSILFCFTVYTLCSVFGNVGKVLAIVLLVFQIGGSGGTFPVELTPRFFQKIHPILPFTYTISLMRESIGGMVKEIVIKNIIVILSVILICCFIGVFLKKPLDKNIRKFSNKFNESHIGE